MWRNYVSVHDVNIFAEFFNMLKNVYKLIQKPQYTYETPMFPTWSQTGSDDILEKSYMVPDMEALNG